MPRGTTARICSKCGAIIHPGDYCRCARTKYAGKPWHETAARTKSRDGGCVAANLAGTPCRGALMAHHIIPVADGGSDHPHNLVTVCAAHHRVAETAGPDSPLGIELRAHAQRTTR